MKKVMVKLENFSKSYGNKTIINDLSLDIYEGEFLTFLGPSGCGKTTILRAIAGIDQVSAGKIYLDEVDVTDVDPTKREVNTLFQNYALFPFMTVEKNIGFGLKMKKVPKDEIKRRVTEMLELIRLNGYEQRKPTELSGGEQQRVSIARGLINKPKVLLLDEPLSALDQKLRKEMQIELKQLQKQLGITFVYVTHDQGEALSMSDRIVILNRGAIEQIGTPKEIYEHPKSKFVADFIGESNLFEGEVVETLGKKATIKLYQGTEITVNDDDLVPNQKVLVLIRPEKFRIVEESKLKNQLQVKIKESIYDGAFYKVIASLDKKHDLKIVCSNKEDIFLKKESVYLEWNIDDAVIIKGEYSYEER